MGEPNDTLIMDPCDVAAGTTRGTRPPLLEPEPRRSTMAAPHEAMAGAKGRFLVALLRALSAWPV
jgi:hypothetical protein